MADREFELTVYAWNRRTARWDDARTVGITVRQARHSGSSFVEALSVSLASGSMSPGEAEMHP